LKEHAAAVDARAILFKPLKAAQLAQCLATVFGPAVEAEATEPVQV
jgi:hypothetical protein